MTPLRSQSERQAVQAAERALAVGIECRVGSHGREVLHKEGEYYAEEMAMREHLVGSGGKIAAGGALGRRQAIERGWLGQTMALARSLSGVLIAGSLVLGCIGCATVNSLQRGAGGETFLVHNRSYDQIWNAAILVVDRQLTIVQSDKGAGTIKAEKRAGIATWGEVVGVFITPDSTDSHTFLVEVESMKRDSFQITGQDWTSTIAEGIKAELGVS